MRVSRIAAAFLLMVMSVGLVAGCGGGGSSSSSGSGGGGEAKTIKIAMVAPFSGDNATYGLAGKRSFELFLEEVNAQGGVGGYKFELVAEDDTGDPKQSVAAAQKYADQKDIMVMVGSALSSNTLAMVPILEKAGLPQLVYSSSSTNLSGVSPNFYRVAILDDQMGRMMARLAVRVKKAKTFAGMYINNDYGKMLSEVVNAECRALGAEITGNYAYLANDRDFQAILTEIKAQNPDVLILSSQYTDAGLITKQARQMGLTMPIVSHASINSSKFIEIAGDAAEGVIVPVCFVADNPDPKCKAFVEKFQQKFNIVPDNYAALAYDLAGTIVDACRKAIEANELTREGIKKALEKSDYQGITGKVTFNDQHEWDREYLMVTVKGGKFTLTQE